MTPVVEALAEGFRALRRVRVARLGAGIVAGVAGYASYQHIYRVARLAGEHVSVAAVYPLATDGLIVAATAALFDATTSRRQLVAARFGLVAGVAATLAYNVLSTRAEWLADPWVRGAIAAWPALAFLLAVEILTPRRRQPAEQPDVDEHQDVDPIDDELRQLVDELGPYAGRRGELTDRVRQLVDARPDLAGDVDRLTQLAGGSARHVARIVKTLTPEGAAA